MLANIWQVLVPKVYVTTIDCWRLEVKKWRIFRKKVVKLINTITQSFFCWWPKNNVIVLESKPGFSDNTYAVYLELLKRHYNNKYRFVWFVEGASGNPKLAENTTCFTVKNTISNIIFRNYILQTASFVISCNSRLYSTRKGHNNIHLGHGSPLKDPGTYVFLNEHIDRLTIQAKYFKAEAARVYDIPSSKIIATGYPRSDFLMGETSEQIKNIVRENFEKVIIWLPTFRSSGGGGRVDSTHNMPFGIPIIQNKNAFEKLNELLRRNNSLLIIKYHFAQDNQHVFQYSNIRVVENEYFFNREIQLYEFLKYTDALITDYSSVYYEYLMLEKPIGLTVDDIDEYIANRGLVVDDYFSDIPGEYIYNLNDLYCFIESICNGLIGFDDKMMRAKNRYNDYFDGNSAARVVDYLENVRKL